MNNERGYIGLLLLLLGSVLLVLLYMNYSPLRSSSGTATSTISQGKQAIETAKAAVQNIGATHDAEILKEMEQ